MSSLIARLVKNPPAMQEIPVQFLGWEDPLEREMATHSSILAWKILWTEKCSRLQLWGHRESNMTEQLCTHTRKYANYILMYCSKIYP